jgi:hypothetical protein
VNIEPIILTWRVAHHMISRIPILNFKFHDAIRTSLFLFWRKKTLQRSKPCSDCLKSSWDRKGDYLKEKNKHRAADFGNFVPKTELPKYVPGINSIKLPTYITFFHIKYLLTNIDNICKSIFFIKIFTVSAPL